MAFVLIYSGVCWELLSRSFPTLQDNFQMIVKVYFVILRDKDLPLIYLWDPERPFQVYDLNGITMEDELLYGPKHSEQSFLTTFMLGNQCWVVSMSSCPQTDQSQSIFSALLPALECCLCLLSLPWWVQLSVTVLWASIATWVWSAVCTHAYFSF